MKRSDKVSALLAGFQGDSDDSRVKLARTASLIFTVLSAVLLGVSIALGRGFWRGAIPASVAGVLMYGSGYLLMRGRARALGLHVFVYGIFVATTVAGIADPPDSRRFGMYGAVACVLLVLGAFLLSSAGARILSALTCLLLALRVVQQARVESFSADVGATQFFTLLCVGVLGVLLSAYQKNARANEDRLNVSVLEIERVLEHAARIAKGDLTGEVEGESEVSKTIRAMRDGLRSLAGKSREAAAVLVASTQQISVTAHQQEQGTLEQAAAVAQIHEVLSGLVEGSTAAARSTEDVARNMERVQKTTEIVTARARTLSSHTKRIQAILEVIKGIANKSEILALNAALEGARAGEAGRGFSLVASQMQRLAESVMGSVRDVRSLVEDIEASSSATLSATEESARLSADVAGAARQIHATIEQQRGSTGMVARAVEEIRDVTRQISEGSTQAFSATRDLARLADELRAALEKFRLP